METIIKQFGRYAIVEITGGEDGPEWEVRDETGAMVSDGYNSRKEAVKDARAIEEWAGYEDQPAPY